MVIIIIISVLPKGRSFIANSGTKVAILSKGGSSIEAQEPRVQLTRDEEVQ